MKPISMRIALFILLSVIAIWMAFPPILNLLRAPRVDLYYSHIPLIPALSAYFMIRRRKELFEKSGPYHIPGLMAMAAGIGLFLMAGSREMGSGPRATVSTSATLIFWAGSFLLLFGLKAVRKAAFPISFLIFAIPVPSSIMDEILSTIALATTHMTSLFFGVVRVPFMREDSIFHLPGFSLEIGPECAGWRSSIALLILSILAGHLFLKKSWKKGLLVLAVFPLAIVKNAARIVVLYLISYFIDMRFIEGGFLHRSVGYVMFFVGLCILGFVLWLLREAEG